MAEISFSGLGGGVKFSDIIDKLVEVARAPIKTLEAKKANYQDKITLYQDLNTKLLAFRTRVNGMNMPSEFTVRSAASSDTTKVTAAATGTAATGTHTISIAQLAKVEQETHSGTSSKTASLTASDAVFQYTYAGTQRLLTVTAGTSLEGLVDQINGDSSNPGVTASILDDGSGSSTAYHLVLSGKDTGYTKTISIDSGTTLSGYTSAAFTQTQGATGSVVGVNGYQSPQAEIETHSGSGVTDSSTVVNNSGSSKAFEFTYGGTTYSVSVANGTTLSGLVSAINTAASGKVTASVYNTNQLRLTGAEPGLSRTIAVTSNTTLDGTSSTIDFRSSTFTQTQGAQGIERSTNAVSDVVTGVTFNLGATTSSAVSVTVSTDTSAVAKKIKDFVTDYNDLIKYVLENSAYDAATKTAGGLLGEQPAANVLKQVRNIVTSQIPNLSDTYTALSQIGITTGSDGLLVVDDSKLTTALGQDYESVAALFVDNGTTDGVAHQLSTTLDNLTSIVDGPVHLRKEYYTDQITEIDEQIARKEVEIEKYELSLKIQYAAVESLLSGLNAQGSYMSTQLGFMLKS
jgi:flagellar hook-associated protein 2